MNQFDRVNFNFLEENEKKEGNRYLILAKRERERVDIRRLSCYNYYTTVSQGRRGEKRERESERAGVRRKAWNEWSS